MRRLCLVMQPPLATVLQVGPLSSLPKLNTLLSESGGTKKYSAVVYTFERNPSVSAAMRGDESPRVAQDHLCAFRAFAGGKKSADSGVQADMIGSATTAIASSIVGKVHTCVTGSQLICQSERSGRRPSFWLVPVSKHTPCTRSGPKINCYWGASENKRFRICATCVCVRETGSVRERERV